MCEDEKKPVLGCFEMCRKWLSLFVVVTVKPVGLGIFENVKKLA
jgi:hypothetical protein